MVEQPFRTSFVKTTELPCTSQQIYVPTAAACRDVIHGCQVDSAR